MKKVSILLPFLLLCAFIPCKALFNKGTSPTNAKELDIRITAISDSVLKYATQFGILIKDKKFEKMPECRKRIILLIDSGIDEVKSMQDFGGSNEYRRLFIVSLQQLHGLIIQAYMPFEALFSNYSDKAYQKNIDELIRLSIKEDEIMEKLNQEQMNFKTINGIK